MVYTVGVTGRLFGLFFRRHKVTGHTIEVLGNSPRIALLLVDGSTLIIPGLDRRRVKLYPDYRMVMHAKQGQQAPAVA